MTAVGQAGAGPSSSRNPSPNLSRLGRSFVHPAFDTLLIGGGLSLVFAAVLVASPELPARVGPLTLATLLLTCNMAHFASSTVRLYSKPGAFRTWPFLTMVLPLLSLVLLTLCMFQAGSVGAQLQKLYLTWSPYHFAAQAYGLAVMYSYRSGCLLGAADKRLLRVAALLPFVYVFATAPGIGLEWLVPAEVLARWPVVVEGRRILGVFLIVLALVLPLGLYVRVWRTGQGAMPLLAPLVLLANGIWWFVFPPLHAFLWATIFHGIQYLAIVIIFHVRDQLALPGNRHGTAYHVLRFYALSLLLGYVLFRVLPQGYLAAGFGMVESLLLVTAAINIHHFVVDAFILAPREGRGQSPDRRRRPVGSGVRGGPGSARRGLPDPARW